MMTNEKAAVDTNIFRQRAEKLEKTLEGIASCATQCPCCEMHRQLAVKALGYEVEITTDTLTA